MKYEVQQTITVSASAEKISSLVHDLTNWPSWSPWLCLDRQSQVSFDDNDGLMKWQSDVVGEGELEKAEQSSNQLKVDLRFFKPFKTSAQALMAWQSKGEQQQITWTMFGNMPWYLFFMIPMMKGWIRMDYRRGLARLKAVAEQGEVPAQLGLKPGVTSVDGFTFVGIEHKQVRYADMPRVMEQDFADIVEQLGTAEDANYMAFYDKVSISDDTFNFASGVCFASAQQAPSKPKIEGWVVRHIPEHQVIEVEMRGPYEFLGDAWSMAMMNLKPKGLKMNKRVASYEQYVKGTFNEESAKQFQTRVRVPVK